MTWAASASTLILFNRMSLYEENTEPALVARRADGRWAELAAPGDSYLDMGLASAGDSVVAVGVVCEGGNEECVQQYYEYWMLSSDLRTWTRLDARPESSVSEPSARGYEGHAEVALFFTAAGTIAVDADGKVGELPDLPTGSQGYGCLVGSTLSSISATAPNPNSVGDDTLVQPTASMHRIDVLDPSGGWTTGAEPPKGIESAAGSACTAAGQLFIDAEFESTYDALTDRWEQRPADGANSVLAGEWISSAPTDSIAGPEGSTYLVTVARPGRIVRQAPDGTWSDTGARGASVLATSEAVYAFPLDSPEPVEVR